MNFWLTQLCRRNFSKTDLYNTKSFTLHKAKYILTKPLRMKEWIRFSKHYAKENKQKNWDGPNPAPWFQNQRLPPTIASATFTFMKSLILGE